MDHIQRVNACVRNNRVRIDRFVAATQDLARRVSA
jgi:hypothetical protein